MTGNRLSELDAIRPAKRQKVMEAVQEAGIDVSDWANYAKGKSQPAANPKYCYEWSFLAEGKVLVLNLWFNTMSERRGVITAVDNMRVSAEAHSKQGGKSVWARRSEKLDNDVRKAWQSGIPVRTVIIDGKPRKKHDLKAKASTVNARELDQVPWAITDYDDASGRFVVTRGAIATPVVDQFDLPDPSESVVEFQDKLGRVYFRNPAVRKAVLKRANGRCEFCGRYGFVTAGGGVFLETHHIVPLSEKGHDTVKNVAALCPTHHREAHLGARRETIRKRLLGRASKQ